MSNDNMRKLQEEGISFLANDFNQCFEQARYYDAQIVDIFKYLATFYTTIAGLAIGLYQLKGMTLSPALISGLTVALSFGLCMFYLIVRNRVYFVFCMRYINEQRGMFLSCKPLGFENKSKMYTDCTKPILFNPLSSQSWWLYVVAILNSALLSAILYITKQNFCTIIILFIIAALLQLITGFYYLRSRDNKSASATVFGAKKGVL
ncbi:MAG: hypothetical protein WC500_06580 [Candidatus Margulisiibacteriota bacterium]